MFVIQGKEKPWKNTYKTLDYLPRYETIEESREDFKKIPEIFKPIHRIAEEYTVIRYKAVK